ncbi:hypothetical protein ACIBCB_18215 [Streptomyces uncialis]|uniref:hypothetical protein n=1 Tax=Streptomyces uncialis TaxID=1048205 RepID=UPI0037B2BD3E
MNTSHLACPKCAAADGITFGDRQWASCATCSYRGLWGEFQVCECWGYECPPLAVQRESDRTIPLSTGDLLGVRVERGPTGDVMVHERNPYSLEAGGRIYWRGDRLHLLVADEQVPIKDPRFETAATADDVAELALAFFVQCAESAIQHARAEGIPVEHCYA